MTFSSQIPTPSPNHHQPTPQQQPVRIMLKAFSGEKKQRQWRSRGAVLRYSPSCSDWGASSPPAGGETARGPGLLPWLPSPPARLKLHSAGTWPPQSHPRPRLLLLLLLPPCPPRSSFPLYAGEKPSCFSWPLLSSTYPPSLSVSALAPSSTVCECVAGHVWCACMCVYRPPSLRTWCRGRLTIVPPGFDIRVRVSLEVSRAGSWSEA